MGYYLYTRKVREEIGEITDELKARAEEMFEDEEHKDFDLDDKMAALEAADRLKGDNEQWDRLKECQDLLDEVGGDVGFLIPDDDFEEYAEDHAQNIGLGHVDQWPLNCVDWSKAAYLLKQDFQSVEFNGTTYWYGEQ